jgi:hypothetical protein
MESIFGKYTTKYGYIDYVGCWFMKSAEYLRHTKSSAALAATNSICQGRQLPQVWPHVLREDIEIFFAHHSFKWANSAVHNAGVICVIVGISTVAEKRSKTINDGGFARSASNINPYLIDAPNLIVKSVPKSLCRQLSPMLTGSVPNDGGNLILTGDEARELVETFPSASNMLHAFYGSKDYLQGIVRNCLVIGENDLADACAIPSIAERLDRIARLRAKSKKKETREQLASVPHRFQHVGEIPSEQVIIVPSVSSERREWFPTGILPGGTVISNLAFMLPDAPLWNMALIASRIHLVWIGTVCGKLKTDFRYSNTLGWNTFPVPVLTAQNKADLTRCAEDILLAREFHFPATIAELYDPAKMPANLREAHDRNDETLERIYLGRRFKNDTERLEKLFELYTKMAGAPTSSSAPRMRKPMKES